MLWELGYGRGNIPLNLAHVRCREDALVPDLYFERETLVLLDIDMVELGWDDEGQDVALAAVCEHGDQTALSGGPAELAIDGASQLVNIPTEAVRIAQIGGDIDGRQRAVRIAEGVPKIRATAQGAGKENERDDKPNRVSSGAGPPGH